MATPEDRFTERLISVIDDAGGAAHVAREMDMTPNAVRLWLRGTRPYPHHIRNLCEKLGIDRHWLLTGEQVDGVRSDGSLAHTSAKVNEEPLADEFTTLPDEALTTKIIEMVKGLARVPASYLSFSIKPLRAIFAEFIARAEARAQGSNVKFPTPKPAPKKPRP